MGMNMQLFALTVDSLAELVADPKRMPAFTQTEDIKKANDKLKVQMEANSPGGWEKMQTRKQEMWEQMRQANPDALAFNNPWYNYDAESEGYKSRASLDIDKTFQGIHFLLTGTAEGGKPPLSLLIFGGQPIGDSGVYNAERYLGPDEVSQMVDALESRSLKEWGLNYDATRMMQLEIYPEIWQRDSKEALDYLLTNLEVLIAFLKKSADQNLAIFKLIS